MRPPAKSIFLSGGNRLYYVHTWLGNTRPNIRPRQEVASNCPSVHGQDGIPAASSNHRLHRRPRRLPSNRIEAPPPAAEGGRWPLVTTLRRTPAPCCSVVVEGRRGPAPQSSHAEGHARAPVAAPMATIIARSDVTATEAQNPKRE
jgi:hypothetical protein